MTRIKTYLFTILLLLPIIGFNSNVFAQDTDTLKPGDVIIIKEFEPTITDAFKISDQPQAIETEPPPIPETPMLLLNKEIKVDFDIEPIKPATMKGEALDRLYRMYTKLGAGNYASSLAEIDYNSLRSKTSAYGLKYRHYASTGGVKDVAYSGFSNNAVNVYGKKIFYNKLLSGGLDFDHRMVHHYGFNPDTVVNSALADSLIRPQIRQRFIKYGGNVHFSSHYKDSTKINFESDAVFYQLYDRFGTSENNFLISGKAERFFDKEQAVLNASVDYNNFNTALVKFNNTIVRVSPNVNAFGEKFKVSLGLDLYANADSLTTYHIYPNVHVKYNVLKEYIVPYAGVKGGIERNNFNSLSYENPYIISNPLLKNTNRLYDVYGGIRGAFTNKISFNLAYSHSRLRDLPLFVNDMNAYVFNRFHIVYDTLSITNITGEFSYLAMPKLNVVFRGDYYRYSITNQYLPWHLPSYKFCLSGVYDLYDKIVLRADVIALSHLYAKSALATDGDLQGYENNGQTAVYAKRLPNIVDINLQAEYRYNKRVSAYVQMMNMASMNYQRWNNYPMQRFTILGGLTFNLLAE
jgi:hypothetical protein